jgi:glucosyl-3-phosphoglycerate synthase
MTGVRTFKLVGITADDVVRSKAGRTVSLCIPCRNEAATIGSLVSIVRSELMTRTSVVDELIVLDDRSVDGTAQIASQAGARVVSIDDVHRIHGTGHGKGNALWATLLVSHGDIVVWCDGDITSFHPDWVLKLISPLLGDESVALIKALYHRPTHHGGGGRTTELVARPLLSRYYPSLTGLAQPLSGEFAARRSVVEQIEFVEGWGVEIAMLIDIASRYSPESIGQVDLGSRLHRHRDLTSLSIQAAEVIATLLNRAGAGPGEGGAASFLHRADGSSEPLNLMVRPSLVDLGLGRGTSTAHSR